MRRILILGAGTAGSIVANRLRRRYPSTEMSITVVDRDDIHMYQAGYVFIPFGMYTDDMVTKPRGAQLRKGIDFIIGDIDRVDAEQRRVLLGDGRALDYDVLIVATGVGPRPDQTEGMLGAEWGISIHEFYTLEGARKLRDALRSWEGGRLLVHTTEIPIKCPVAPLEFAFLAHDYLDQRGFRKATDLVYVTPLDGAFTKPVAAAELGGSLDERNIALVTDFMVSHIDAENRLLVSYDGREEPFDLLVTIPVNMGADYVARSGLGNELNLIPNDPQTMISLAHGDIFVLGDAGTLPTSKAGAVAHFSIDIFMENIEQYLRGQAMTHHFDGHANCFVETGRGKAMLLDFNYETEPLTGMYPLPKIGPMKLLGESRMNHVGKLAFRHLYWSALIPGLPLPLPADMSMLGKNPAGTKEK